MPTFKVNVKWGKEKFNDIECNTDDSPVVFKAQLFALSGVQPERQKVMMKGAVLKDEDWGKIKLKDGATLLMMGSADELPQAPVQKTVFMEDMSETQLASVGKSAIGLLKIWKEYIMNVKLLLKKCKKCDIPAGLSNLGNTCYMNATIQCLRSIPELKGALKRYKGDITMAGEFTGAGSITAAMRDLYNQIDKSSQAMPPIIFVQVLHMVYPQFAEKGEHGGFTQQDANECWTEIVRCLQQKLQMTGTETASSPSFIDKYLGIESEVTMKCQETEDEAETKTTEKQYQLSCFIEKEIKYMHSGLRSRLEEAITKNSPTLGRDALYKKSSQISRLPGYLAIQFVRFYYKEKENVNAKILKDIKFPLNLDVYELCTPELQKKLTPIRDKFKEIEDRDAENLQKAKSDGKKTVEKKENVKTAPFSFEDDPGSNNSGYYQLQAVLTHKGRSSSSGHYVAWVRKKGDDWFMFDDENVVPVTSEDILKLSGGGDWHCAYVLLYGPSLLELEDELPEEEKKETPMEQS